jgi:hypothetical protein
MNRFEPERDTVVTVLADSMELYGSRLRELTAERGEYTVRIQPCHRIQTDLMKLMSTSPTVGKLVHVIVRTNRIQGRFCLRSITLDYGTI